MTERSEEGEPEALALWRGRTRSAAGGRVFEARPLGREASPGERTSKTRFAAPLLTLALQSATASGSPPSLRSVNNLTRLVRRRPVIFDPPNRLLGVPADRVVFEGGG